jgi:rare lipoprotein A
VLIRLITWAFAVLLLQACSHSRYQQAVDSTPVFDERIKLLKEPRPKSEPMSRIGNPDQYEVWGQTYQVSKGLTEYSQVGTASWYGQKFHGHATSNGESFDVYAFSAAHKSLPLPSYVRVTNLKNKKSLIVRVNDRGPFHGDRLIDLSYAAAVRLGFVDLGTAQVKVDLIAAPYARVKTLTQKAGRHLQVGAFKDPNSALKLQQRLASLLVEPVYIQPMNEDGKTLHKVRVGPVKPQRLEAIQMTLVDQQLSRGLLLPDS